MLYVLLSTFIILPCIAGIGRLFLFSAINSRFSGLFFNGLFWIILLWSLWAFGFPINFEVEVATLILGWLVFIREKLYIQILSIKYSSIFYVALGAIGFVASFYPFILDHFGYYVPTISWIKQWGWVKGLANVEWILGQMSFWHLLQAGFSHFTDSYLRLNAVFLISFLFYIEETKRRFLYWLLPICLFFVQSPSPDLPVILLSLVLVFEMLNQSKKYLALSTISMLIFTIKPTLLWTPILGLLYLLQRKSLTLKNTYLAISIFLLYIVKNLWVSGYPLFPTSLGNILHMPWMAHPSNFQVSSEFALMKTFDMQYSYEFLMKATFSEKMKLWLMLPGIKGIINWLFLLTWVAFGIFVFCKKKKLYFAIALVLLIKSVFVLLFSAQYRFYIDVFVVIYSMFLLDFIKEKQIKWMVYPGILAVLIFFSYPKMLQNLLPSFRVSQFMQGWQIQQLLKPQEYHYRQDDQIKLGNTTFYVVDGYSFIFDARLPGITLYNLQKYLEHHYIPQQVAKGNSMIFEWKPLDANNKKIIEEYLKSKKP